MNTKHILRGIEAYKNEQKEILNAIERHGGRLTQKEFDAQFKDFFVIISPNGDSVQERANAALKFQTHDRGAFLLGTDPGNWPKYLDLAQLMCAAGLISITREEGLIMYRKVERSIRAARKSRGAFHHSHGRYRAVKSP